MGGRIKARRSKVASVEGDGGATTVGTSVCMAEEGRRVSGGEGTKVKRRSRSSAEGETERKRSGLRSPGSTRSGSQGDCVTGDEDEMADGEAQGFLSDIGTDVEDEEEIVKENEHDSEKEKEGKDGKKKSREVYRIGIDTKEDDEVLTYDPSAYDYYHQFSCGWPALSLDLINDSKSGKVAAGQSEAGATKPPGRRRMALDFLAVAGSQANDPKKNMLYVVKGSNIKRTFIKSASDSESESASDSEADSESDSDSDAEAALGVKAGKGSSDVKKSGPAFAHAHIEVPYGSLNNLEMNKSVGELSSLCAIITDSGSVLVHDLDTAIESLNDPRQVHDPRQAPLYLAEGSHSQEGFALAWNAGAIAAGDALASAQFVTGARDGRLALHTPSPGGWTITDSAFFAGESSAPTGVETVSFKADDKHIFAAGGMDGRIVIFDTRVCLQETPATVIRNAHEGDVNCVAFRLDEERNHILSGGDDGMLYVRDIRYADSPLAQFQASCTKSAVYSVAWSPHDSCTFLSATADDVVSIWDLSVEDDAARSTAEAPSERKDSPDGVCDQTLFQHMGQSIVTQVKWHPRHPFMAFTTAQNSIDLFRPEVFRV